MTEKMTFEEAVANLDKLSSTRLNILVSILNDEGLGDKVTLVRDANRSSDPDPWLEFKGGIAVQVGILYVNPPYSITQYNGKILKSVAKCHTPEQCIAQLKKILK